MKTKPPNDPNYEKAAVDLADAWVNNHEDVTNIVEYRKECLEKIEVFKKDTNAKPTIPDWIAKLGQAYALIDELDQKLAFEKKRLRKFFFECAGAEDPELK